MVLVIAYQLPVFYENQFRCTVFVPECNSKLQPGKAVEKESSARENEQSCLRALECFQLSFIGLGIVSD